MTLPFHLVIHESVFTMDGGTTTLLAKDATGREHTVRLVQHAFPNPRGSTDEVPGRLYFDGELVPVRSEFEEHLLRLLRSADVTEGGRLGNMVGWLAATEVVRYVSSDEYLSFAERVEQATDKTLYDLWVAWADGTFGWAVMRTRQLLNLTVEEAGARVEQGRPVATGLAAPEVVEWAERYRLFELGVRVVPEFRWRLP